MTAQPADIILYTVTPRSGWTSKAVVIGELLVGAGRGAVQYSHATILSERYGYQYEAKWPMTGHYPIDRHRPYEVWNVGNPTDSQRIEILAWCRARSGEWYNMVGLLTGGLLGLPHTEVCSQFVGLAYASARPSIHISPEGQRLLSPNAIVDRHDAKLVKKFVPYKGE